MALYLEHFGLAEPPFRITPHPEFFFDGADRGATLEGLAYAILHDEGIVKVSGEVGSGKTMLCRVLMERLPEQVETIYLATPSLARDEILHAIADELELKLSQPRTSVALRELRNIVIRLTTKHAGRRLPAAELEPEFDLAYAAPAEASPGDGDVLAQAMRHLERSRGVRLDEMLQSLERGYIEAALKLTRGNVSQAAKLLGVNRTTLYSRMNAGGEK